MPHFKRTILLVSLLCLVTTVGDSSFGEGLDHIGARVVIPFGKTPLMLGLDIGTHLTFGLAVASLLLSPNGETLMLASIEARIAGSENAGVTLIRGTIGLSYFDLSAPLPSFILGGGLTYRFSVDEHMSIGASSEIIYPLALGPPMLAFSAGWSP